MAQVHVVKPGMLTTIQDRGRWGFQDVGVSVAGPMDLYSFRAANAAAGNPQDAAALEITIVGPELEFEDERLVAITGAEFELTLDGRTVDGLKPFAVFPGARLRFGQRRAGARAYLAVAGGFDVPATLGSRSTHLLTAMGGFNGRVLRAGDRLPLGLAGLSGPPRGGHYRRPGDEIRQGEPAILRILPGPQEDRFVNGSLQTLQSAPYEVGADSDRMGFRLKGPSLIHSRGADIISDATPLGAVQVPASGDPILLMADRQTAGGYPKIATVISADIGVAGQLGPGDRLAFVVCSPAEAMCALIAQERALLAMES